MTIKRRVSCHLWEKEVITKDDLDFDVVSEITKSSHFDRFVVRCKRCGQLYLYEFVEEGKWGGGDIIHTAFVPIDEKDTEEFRNKPSLEVFSIRPRLQWDFDTLYWIGRKQPKKESVQNLFRGKAKTVKPEPVDSQTAVNLPERIVVSQPSEEIQSTQAEIVTHKQKIVARPKRQRRIQLYQKPVHSFVIAHGSRFIDFSKNGKFAAIVEAQPNPKLFIVDIYKGSIHSLSSLEQGLNNLSYGGGGNAWSMAISNNGEWVAVGYDDGDILCWDVKNKRVLSRDTGDIWREPISCLAFLPNSQCYAAYGGYNHLNVHDIGSAKYLHPIPCHLNVHALAFTDDGCKLLMGGYSDHCCLYLP